MGFTPNLTAAVWFGMDRPITIREGATGGGDAAPVWGRFMRRVYYGEGTRAQADSVLRARGYLPPLGAEADPEPGVEVDSLTALEGVEAAEEPVEIRGYLLPIPEPWPILEGLTTREVDSKTGLLASRWCPAERAYLELFLPGTEPTEPCDQSGPRIFRQSPRPR
jgi:membrane peptidoglycan carboxypeptidase